jgi:hypothetical protein
MCKKKYTYKYKYCIEKRIYKILKLCRLDVATPNASGMGYNLK